MAALTPGRVRPSPPSSQRAGLPSQVAIKVINKDGDMNDDESMQTELDIIKMVHHR